MSTPILVAMVSIYNSSRWLRQRIENLLDTTIYRRGGLLIFLTNASSPDDKDRQICLDYRDRPGIRYEEIPFCTVYATWNWMIKHSETPFITNANSDDLIAPNAYDILIEACTQHNSDLAYCGWYTIGDEVMCWSDIKGNGEPVGHYNPAADQMSCGHFPLWRRSLHDRVGLFDPTFSALGDADLWYRCWINGIRNFMPITAPLGGYRWRNGQNLWHATPEDKRSSEWQKLSSRQPGKLEFQEDIAAT